ncbi:hypothetical protein O3G_MSEX007763 [Manduca sexta]|uniref:Uncharacterized protein n=1 Tax=Manduca sexta TaxID=7130 RepID=A0A921Z8F5_MANSE|nr:hypothetical protein O3G_MSEX007763 [Manduca sexta]
MQALNADLPEIKHDSPIAMVILIVTLTGDSLYVFLFETGNSFIRNVIVTATNICCMSNIILFELMFYRLKSLRKTLKKELKSTCLSIDGSEGNRADIINDYMQIYKKIATSAEQATNSYFFATMVCRKK